MSKLVARIQFAVLERRSIRTIVWFSVIGALLYLVFVFWLGWQGVMAAFTAIGLQALVVGAILSCSSYLWRFGRWESCLRSLGDTVPRVAHLCIYISGLALTATPGKSGEMFRSALLVQHGVKVSHSLAAFLVDRGTDVLGMVLLGMLAAMAVGQEFAWVWLLSFAVILMGSYALACLLLQSWAGSGWARFDGSLTWLPIKGGKATLEGWAKVWKPQKVLAYSTVAMLAYGTQALVFFWFCHVLGTGIAIADCVLVFVQATLFGAASMIPGGLGATEAALMFQLVERGVSDDVAMSIAIAIRLVTLWFGMLLGVFCLLYSRRNAPSVNCSLSLKQHRK